MSFTTLHNVIVSKFVNVTTAVVDLFRVAALHQFIVQRLPAGIYGSDDDIDPANRGFKIMSRDDLRALIDVGYAKVCVKYVITRQQVVQTSPCAPWHGAAT